MADEKKYVAVDLGAESGRVMLGSVSSEKLSLEEIHRFGNGPVEEAGTLRWDFEKLMRETKTGIAKAAKAAGADVCGIGVDSWGVDFGLLDENGDLVEKPYHYRDSRTNGIMDKAFELMDKREIYENTGLQFMQLNSLYQVLAARMAGSEALAKTKSLIFIADLVSYFLCDEQFAEYSLASTSQMMDMKTGQWSDAIFEKLSLPKGIMPKVVQPGTVVGVPAAGGNWAYLSSGTWSLMGLEVPNAIINDKTFKYEFTNEGGVDGTIRLLKNIMGLWLLQECRRQWQRDGVDLGYAEIAEMAEKAEAFAGYVNPDDSLFLAPGDMPARINEYLERTGQRTTDDKGQMARMILESLALKYRSVMEALEDVSGEKVEVLHIVGGGIQNELLCQFAANATGKKVVTGPIEATASGNILMQAKAAGQIGSLDEGRAIVRQSFELKEYEPHDVELWAGQYDKVSGIWK